MDGDEDEEDQLEVQRIDFVMEDEVEYLIRFISWFYFKELNWLLNPFVQMAEKTN